MYSVLSPLTSVFTEFKVKFIITPEDEGIRADKLLSERIPEMSRSKLQRLFESGDITQNGEIFNKKNTLKAGDVIEINIPEAVVTDTLPQDIPIDIIYEDEDVAVVNKPKGMVVHPAPGNPDNTLVNALLFHLGGRLSGINGEIRPGIVHRLDKNTGGLLIIAKNDFAHVKLSEQIKTHSFTREYEAIVTGRMKEPHGFIEVPLWRSKTDRKKIAVMPDGREAKTEYTLIDEIGSGVNTYSHLRIKLFTGRTHQIRVHMAHIGHPVFGDNVYGKPDTLCDGQCLFAKKIGFVHPVTENYLEFEASLPDWFCNTKTKLQNKYRN
ncbi:MAG: RluA family pseudouridine synthase [Ruminococcus sp.]|jgi:23S rRNA pseudouridine1911/1915/1917 synthase|nr:RluA family pseudouridine synthase [Ruminococcus sp.]